MSDTSIAERIEAMLRWLLEDGHITPLAARQIQKILDDTNAGQRTHSADCWQWQGHHDCARHALNAILALHQPYPFDIDGRRVCSTCVTPSGRAHQLWPCATVHAIRRIP